MPTEITKYCKNCKHCYQYMWHFNNVNAQPVVYIACKLRVISPISYTNNPIPYNCDYYKYTKMKIEHYTVSDSIPYLLLSDNEIMLLRAAAGNK